MESNNIDLSISIASWNTRKLLCECLSSIYSYTKNVAFDVIVIDNASEDGSPDIVKKEFPKVKLLINKKNLGFSKAHNQAAHISNGKYFLVLNSDTFISDDSFSVMVKLMKSNEKIAMCGPKTLNPDFSEQGNRFHTLNPFEAFLLITNLYNYKWDSKYLIYKKSSEVEAVGGVCMMFRKQFFLNVGGFDEKLKIYNEEHDISIRLRNSGWKVYYCPESKIHHYIGSSSKKQTKTKMQIDAYVSNVHYYKKHFSKFTYYFLRTVYKAAFVTKIILSFFRFVLNPSKNYFLKSEIKLGMRLLLTKII